MPPKKKQTNGSTHEKDAKAEEAPQLHTNSNHAVSSDEKKAKPSANETAKKRKAGNSSASPNKAPRRSGCSAPSASTDSLKLLQYLLSPSSLELCRPKDETEDLKNRGADTRTYSSSTFTPFEELVCATILSRPIGHMLGLRSIRTIFNAPYNLTSPKAIRKAGNEGCREALDKARTQHRQKTAEELVILADAVVDTLGSSEDDVSLEKMREACGDDVDKQREMLKKNIKGLGKTGLDIFARRMQGVWEEWYPFIDGRTLGAAEKLGMPGTAEGLKEFLEDNWGELEVKDIEAEGEEEKKRRAFVKILERAVGADLEGNIEDIKTAAA
ncbi:hypothetical protein P7C71_g57, partial [Lecanoromycetidae sp. Uapishka_2]